MSAAKSNAERLREKAERIKAQQQQDVAAKADKAEQHRAAPTVHTKPIRSTVDLAPMQHNALKQWCNESAVEVGRSRVTTQDVFRALAKRLLTDETLARKIRADLRSQ